MCFWKKKSNKSEEPQETKGQNVTVSPIASKYTTRIENHLIKNNELPGNFLYKDKNESTFLKKYTNCLIINTINKDKKIKPNYDIEKYLADQLGVFSRALNRPSVIIKGEFNNNIIKGDFENNYERVSNESELSKFNSTPSYYYCVHHNYFSRVIDALYESRKGVDVSKLQPVFVIIIDVRDINIAKFEKKLESAKMLKVYFIIVLKTLKHYETILPNFNLKIEFENFEISKIAQKLNSGEIVLKDFSSIT